MTQESIPFRPPILAEKLDEKGNFILVVPFTSGVKSRKSSSPWSSKLVTPENLASELGGGATALAESGACAKD